MNRRTFLKSVGAGVALSLASPIGFTSEKFSPVDEELIKKLVTYQPLDGPLGKVFFLQTEKVPSTFGGTGREMSNMVMHVRSQMVDKDATTPTNLFDLLIDDAERIVRTEMDSKFELLKAANDIGRETKRGVGNVIVVDKKNTHLDGYRPITNVRHGSCRRASASRPSTYHVPW